MKTKLRHHLEPKRGGGRQGGKASLDICILLQFETSMEIVLPANTALQKRKSHGGRGTQRGVGFRHYTLLGSKRREMRDVHLAGKDVRTETMMTFKLLKLLVGSKEVVLVN